MKTQKYMTYLKKGQMTWKEMWTEDIIQMVDENMKSTSSWIFREMQVKTTKREEYTLIRMFESKKMDFTKCWQGWEELESHTLGVEM